jgi:hypothetical protein
MVVMLPACGVPAHARHSGTVGAVSTVGEVGHDPGSIAITIDRDARVSPGTQLDIVCNGKVLCSVTAEAQSGDLVFCSIERWYVPDHSVSPGAIAQISVAGGDA